MSAIRTLIIDDDVAVAGIHHGFLLARGGFDVVAMAHTGQQGLDLAAELGPELVLLDIHLPDMSGLDVLQRLRGRRRPVDVLVITASREIDTVRGAMAGGVLHYLVKPFSSQALIERLDEYVMLREELAAGAAGPLDQASIDRLVAPSRRSAAAETAAGHSVQPEPPGKPVLRLPKGLSRPTLDAVIEALKASPEDVSAAGLALQLGLSRVSARRYLEYLVIHGHARLTPRYGAAGRPENRYLWRR
ncbi:response regulator [Arthrobacter sp. ES3-54]|jgi:response regulator of citrate/malate metabolism|uniref:response regulator n=1 Tax=Arthrobacter sp. ES3-54 TaxID=1502991 RepID=UPI002406503F|nr:response regulator [Arthrobacter sp. ES3-54]MDF9750850.1 response regulator of citrate/malate metabolism [Arthrobacter sp. ES3-54]